MDENILKKMLAQQVDFPFESPELLQDTHYSLEYAKPAGFICIDSRQDPAVAEWLKVNGWSHKDFFRIPGGARLLASTDPADAAMKQGALAWCSFVYAHHGARWFIITTHVHCGDYAARVKFKNGEAEARRHLNDLEVAAENICKVTGPDAFVDMRRVDGHGIHPVGWKAAGH